MLMSIDDAATELGVSRTTVDRLLAKGALPRYKIGARTLIKRSDINLFVDGMARR